jgi:hypothetical protein
MFAVPTGSGKSTLKTVLPIELLGVYINADDIEASVRGNGYLDLVDHLWCEYPGVRNHLIF